MSRVAIAPWCSLTVLDDETFDARACSLVGPGGEVLSFVPEEVQNAADLPSLARMLAQYLTLQGQPILVDELERWEVGELRGYTGSLKKLVPGIGDCHIRMWIFGEPDFWLLVIAPAIANNKEEPKPWYRGVFERITFDRAFFVKPENL